MTNVEADLTPWGQASFERDLNWQGELKDKLREQGLSLQDVTQRAEAEPTFDVFDTVMPTARSKHDIGRYALSQGVDVPLIDSMAEWQMAIRAGSAMLRSDAVRDYAGMCGLLSSKVLRLQKDVGIDEAEPGRPTLDPIGPGGLSDGRERVERDKADVLALFEGRRDPTEIMLDRFWRQEKAELRDVAREHGTVIPVLNLAETYASRWRYVPGVNIRVFRDPIVEGKYYLGGQEAHHIWTINDGHDSADVEAHTKRGWRHGQTPETLQYTLPAGRIVNLYEQVRDLPFFDQTQAPVMEMQLGEDGILYFLQYLKTGQTIKDLEEFALPQGNNAISCSQVRGATAPKGERMRIYLDPKVFTEAMHKAGVQVEFNMTISHRGLLLQTAAMNSKVIITDHGLSFKDNHSDSAPLYRPPVAIGMWDGGEIGMKFSELNEEQPFRTVRDPNDSVEYINAIVTSNGRQATIESDWVMRTQYL